MSKVKIDQVKSQIISDSRGQDTIEVAFISNKRHVIASVPSGKSTGTYEAKSVSAEQAVKNITTLADKITKQEFANIKEFDNFLLEADGTKDKSNFGANTTLALSIAFARLLSREQGVPLYQTLGEAAGVAKPGFPQFFCNLINGGLHVDKALNPLPVQEYLVIPQTDSPQKSLELVLQFVGVLGQMVKKYQNDLVQGDEGGFVVSGDDFDLGVQILEETLQSTQMGEQIKFGLDIASSSLWNKEEQKYIWRNKVWTVDELFFKYQVFKQNYPLISIEDPFDEDAYVDWHKVVDSLEGVWVVGDDLTVTNIERIKEAQEKQAANAVIIKPNQIGTVSETLAAVNLAKSYGWKIIVSHRSGETEDDFIADLAYGVAADGLKAGSPLQHQRLVKYQRLIEIEESLK